MSEMSKEMKERYLKEADDHANFLAEKVFKPAFVMAFIHGVKHGRKDLADELKMPQMHFCIKQYGIEPKPQQKAKRKKR